MRKEELIRQIERFGTRHNRRFLEAFSEERLAEYLLYLQQRRVPSQAK